MAQGTRLSRSWTHRFESRFPPATLPIWVASVRLTLTPQKSSISRRRVRIISFPMMAAKGTDTNPVTNRVAPAEESSKLLNSNTRP